MKSGVFCLIFFLEEIPEVINFTDETDAGLTGQELYWLQGTDSFGNTGDAVPVFTDVDAPAITVLSSVMS